VSDARSEILGRVKAATGSLPERTAHPHHDRLLARSRRAPGPGDDRVRHFSKQLTNASGRWADSWAKLAEILQAEASPRGYCAPEFLALLEEVWPEVQAETTFDRQRVDDYSFGITPAWGAIAETGTLILTDGSSPSRLAALAPWVHVAVIPPERIFDTVDDAIAALPDDPSVIFATGPSKTADIEGILIEGVHGPGRQLAILG
jgi:L-lactate dehydrogenase complex protein LldG